MARRAVYLLAYNVAMAAGWSYALYLGVKGALDSEFPSSLAGCMPSGGSVVGMIRILPSDVPTKPRGAEEIAPDGPDGPDGPDS